MDPGKKRADCSVEMEEDDQLQPGDKIQVDFEGRNPEDSDFESIQKLLRQLFLKANIDLAEVTSTIISQNYVGSVIQQAFDDYDDDSDGNNDGTEIFGLTSVINISERKHLACVKQLKEYLLQKCSSTDVKNDLESLLKDTNNQVGFLINERFINVPAQLALPTFQSLWTEVEAAIKKNMKYQFTHFVMVAKTAELVDSKLNKSSKKKEENTQRIFLNAEEEFFCQEASVVIDYCVKNEHDSMIGDNWDGNDDELEPWRSIMVIPATKMPQIMSYLQENLAI